MDSETPIPLLVLSIQQGLGEDFLADLTGTASGGSADFDAGNGSIRLEILAGDPRLNPTWDETVSKARAMILLARFMDVISLDKIKAIYRRLPSDKAVPFAVYLIREKQETDFKMSCPACGQKLWVRDADVGKRGRCPNCKKAFKLPSQAGLMRSQLMLPDAVTVATLEKGNAEAHRKVVHTLSKTLSGDIAEHDEAVDPEIIKKTTVRVQIHPEDIQD